ncbi:MAG TPA: hypothetical protein VN950_22185 [Terriglobales bacterium]|jgi:hypothetical protein|nr:hypothetical protein [Terriglobales bacterium]
MGELGSNGAGATTLYALRDRHDGEVLEQSFAAWFYIVSTNLRDSRVPPRDIS